jgi:D-alanyl-D-alanine carboxypeptidase/D-alanyl-D-alanine-endopeptidase (penicillin-binding protein 4)
VTKLYSCAAALVALGPDHRFVTPVYRRGEMSEVSKGTLRGDLILLAQGDLTFGGRTDKDGKVRFKDQDHTYAGDSTEHGVTDTDPLQAFDDLAKQVKAAGVTKVQGDVLIDDRLFQWATSTGSGPRAVGPVVVNDNVIDLIFTPGKKAGDPVAVTMRPETGYVRADIQVETGPAGRTRLTTVSGDPKNLVIRGVVPAGGKPVLKIIPVERPTEFARTLFIESLKRAGVTVTASPLTPPDAAALPEKAAYEKLTKVAAFTSPPLKDVLTVTLKVSHNLYASTLPLLVGQKRSGSTTLAAGLRAQGAVLKEIGVDTGAISFGGGAGGANADKATPRATVQLLRAMQKRPEWEAYQAALPVLGVDGTLATVVGSDSPARGKVFAKTGTLFWDDALNGRSMLTSKALAGVMTTKDGRELAFAVFVNDVPLPSGVQPTREGKVLGKLAEIVYEYGP